MAEVKKEKKRVIQTRTQSLIDESVPGQSAVGILARFLILHRKETSATLTADEVKEITELESKLMTICSLSAVGDISIGALDAEG